MIMKLEELNTIEQLSQFLDGTQAVIFQTEVSNFSYATMRSNIGINVFSSGLPSFGQTPSKLESNASSAIILLMSEKAKLVLPFTLCLLCGSVFN